MGYKPAHERLPFGMTHPKVIVFPPNYSLSLEMSEGKPQTQQLETGQLKVDQGGTWDHTQYVWSNRF